MSRFGNSQFVFAQPPAQVQSFPRFPFQQQPQQQVFGSLFGGQRQDSSQLLQVLLPFLLQQQQGQLLSRRLDNDFAGLNRQLGLQERGVAESEKTGDFNRRVSLLGPVLSEANNALSAAAQAFVGADDLKQRLKDTEKTIRTQREAKLITEAVSDTLGKIPGGGLQVEGSLLGLLTDSKQFGKAGKNFTDASQELSRLQGLIESDNPTKSAGAAVEAREFLPTLKSRLRAIESGTAGFDPGFFGEPDVKLNLGELLSGDENVPGPLFLQDFGFDTISDVGKARKGFSLLKNQIVQLERTLSNPELDSRIAGFLSLTDPGFRQAQARQQVNAILELGGPEPIIEARDRVQESRDVLQRLLTEGL